MPIDESTVKVTPNGVVAPDANVGVTRADEENVLHLSRRRAVIRPYGAAALKRHGVCDEDHGDVRGWRNSLALEFLYVASHGFGVAAGEPRDQQPPHGESQHPGAVLER